MNKRWFEKLLLKSIFFAILLFILFFAIRLCFVVYSGIMHGALNAESSLLTSDMLYEFYLTFSNGLAYDSRNVMYFVLIYFGLGVLFAWSRNLWLIIGIYSIICIIFITSLGLNEINFFEKYGNVFDANFLPNILAVQIEHSVRESSVFPQILMWIVLVLIFSLLYIRIAFKIATHRANDPFSKIHTNSNSTSTMVYFGVFILLIFFCHNGQIGLSKISLDKELKHANNEFLNQVTFGALRNIFKFYKGYTKIAKSDFTQYINMSPIQAVQEYFELENAKSYQYNLKNLLVKKVENPQSNSIDHIFYIMIDNMNEWRFNSEFDEINLSSGLKSLLDSQNGAKIDIFLQGGNEGITNLFVTLTGLLDVDLPLDVMVGQLDSFESSSAIMLSKLGFAPNFYYGGQKVWKNIARFVASQGFSKSFYNQDALHNSKINNYPLPYEGTLGIYDNHLLAFARDNVLKNRNVKSFNMILTADFDNMLSFDEMDTPKEQISQFIKNKKYHISQKELEIAYFQDKVLSKFIKDISKVLPNSLFIITGTRFTQSAQANLNKPHQIPLAFYSPVLNIHKQSNIGSIIDIMPSIMQLVAPNDYEYISFGSPLVGNKLIRLNEKEFAFGDGVVANERFIYDGDKIYYMHKELAQNKDAYLASSFFQKLSLARALSWWILKNGYVVDDSIKGGGQ